MILDLIVVVKERIKIKSLPHDKTLLGCNWYNHERYTVNVIQQVHSE
jgi:hypothetical protein